MPIHYNYGNQLANCLDYQSGVDLLITYEGDLVFRSSIKSTLNQSEKEIGVIYFVVNTSTDQTESSAENYLKTETSH